MQFVILFHEPAEMFDSRNSGPEAQAYWGAWTAYVGEIQASGVVVHGNGLQSPASALRVQLRDGERLVQTGPTPGLKEQLGGYFAIDVPDLETALAWAAKAPCAAYGATEVRPVLEMQ
jgi:hypothetical protein